MRELNRIYRAQPGAVSGGFRHTGFEWIDFSDVEKSVISFLRRGADLSDYIVFCL